MATSSRPAPLAVQLFDVFAPARWTGNVAAIVDNAGALDDATMQDIARELHIPTTGFVVGRRDREVQVRFFTPAMEVDLCGHVSLAAAAAVSGAAGAGHPAVTIRGRAGQRSVEITAEADGRTSLGRMRQVVPTLEPASASVADVASALRVPLQAIDARSPLEAAFTGLRHLLIPLAAGHALSSVAPDFEALRALCRASGVHTAVAFSPTAPAGFDVACRDFCIAIGLPEEAASGTTVSGVAAWLWKHGRLAADPDGVVTVRASQGAELGRPSEIVVHLRLARGRIASVDVEGRIRRSLTGLMHVDAGRSG